MKNTPHIEVPLPDIVLNKGANAASLEMSNTGGRFLTNRSGAENIFTREKLSEEQRTMQQTVQSFARDEVAPKSPDISTFDAKTTKNLLKRAAKLGLLSADVEDGYDLVSLNSIASAMISESFAIGNSPEFSSMLAAQSENLLTPLILYSSEEQRSSILKKLLSGDATAAYQLLCDKQPLSARVSADKTAYIISGKAHFVSGGENDGFLLILADVDGQATVLLVPNNQQGLQFNKESVHQRPDGLYRQEVSFEDVRITKQQVVHSVGGGKAVVESTYNLGRLKRSASMLGHCKQNINLALHHALESRRFSRAIAHYNLTKGKFADMVLQTYALDSMVYRTAGYLNQSVMRTPGDDNRFHEELLQASEQFSIECSIIKLFGAQALQITSDARRAVRNSTKPLDQKDEGRRMQDDKLEYFLNTAKETSRQQITEFFLEKTLIDELPLRQRVRQIHNGAERKVAGMSPLAAEVDALEIAKQLTIYLFNQALVTLGKDLLNQQQIVELLSNLFIDIYAMDSSICRARQHPENTVHTKIVKAFCVERILDVGHRVELALYSIFGGSRLEKALGRLYSSKEQMNLKYNVFKLKQEIAEHLYSNQTYCY
ncbi:MAG: acyl-CoA dehydrogenase family protein [Calditrichia bacterium]